MLISMLVTLGAWFLYHPEVNVGADAEFPVLGQLAMCTGMTWYLWKPDNQKNAYIALAIVLSGMLAPKFKFMGEVVCFVGFVFFLRGKLQFKSPKTILALVGSEKFQYVLPFEFISLFLLACIIGGLVVSRNQREDK